jgi:uncharacterized membrane protein
MVFGGHDVNPGAARMGCGTDLACLQAMTRERASSAGAMGVHGRGTSFEAMALQVWLDDGGAVDDDAPHRDPMPMHVGQKIQTIAELFARAERRVDRHQLAIERMIDRVGRPRTAYLLASLVILWMLANELVVRFGGSTVDPPPYAWLQLLTSIAALLMTVTILTTQNRVAKLARHRAQLDLQVNLIAEEKVAKLIALMEELRRDLPSVRDRKDSLADEMTEAVDLDAVSGEIEADDTNHP